MSMTVSLSQELEDSLRRRAAELGKEPDALATELLASVLTRRGLNRERLQEISGTSQHQFQASGMTDAQLASELEAAKHIARAAKRGITFNE